MNQVTPQNVPTQAFTDPPPEPMIFTVLVLGGEIWQIGGDVPGVEGGGLKIVSMIEDDEGAIVAFAVPVPGSPLDKQQAGAIFKLKPLTVARTMTLARADTFRYLQGELRDQAVANIVANWTKIPAERIVEFFKAEKEDDDAAIASLVSGWTDIPEEEVLEFISEDASGDAPPTTEAPAMTNGTAEPGAPS
jgi:hypothetical protein